ncbi:hypothetical protein [Erythrobacter litoralis]|uniref:Lipopolysaccharide assembly protein A domain-containing protein n=1 Tax=Erythrobacter litoralis (strain HTCC2594) TaxID=314225 RepID=Q2N9N5_ERYLH|nr:hypothetical protein [Erythrobacter litoralis]ABC63606.1 hypothetical protein ELI_07570 [Erythrobacter litoralis HTCC2594]
MQIVRTIVWVLILVALLLFSWFNWTPVEVTIWDNLLVETKVPALVIVSFLLGLLPMWMYHRGVRWTLSRKIASLENAARTHIEPPPASTEDPAPAPTPASSTPPPPQPDSDGLQPETDRP